MLFEVTKKPIDEKHIRGNKGKDSGTLDYNKAIVKKPWGYEYLVFENDFVAIWLLQIVRKRKTSMHCHPRKNTGLILLSGHGTFFHSEGSIEIHRLDGINIQAGAFHSTEATSILPIDPISENGIWVMEIETPPLKEDLCRLADAYGRAGISYEGSGHMIFEPKEILKLEEPQEPDEIFRKTFLELILKNSPIWPPVFWSL